MAAAIMWRYALWTLLVVWTVAERPCNQVCYRRCLEMDPGADCAGVCGCTKPTPSPGPQHSDEHHTHSESHHHTSEHQKDEDEIDQDDTENITRKSKATHSKQHSDHDEDESSDQDDSSVDHSHCSHASPSPPKASSKKPRKKLNTIVGLSIVDRCQEKCAVLCPDGGVCMKECYTHFCGIVEEGSQQRRILLLCAIAMTAMFGFWLVGRIKRKPDARVDERPFISLRSIPSEI